MLVLLTARWRPCAVMAAGCVWLAGCATSREPQYFLLSGGGPPPDAGVVSLPEPARVIQLLPIRMPAYLDRPQIVTRPAPWQIQTSDFHRWGMPLDVAVTDLLVAVLARELPAAALVTAPPAGAAPAGRRPASCRVWVEIDCLDGALGGEVVLAARWTVTAEPGSAGDEQPALRRAAHCRQPTSGPGYDAYVQAIGAAVAQLGKELGESLREL